MQEPVCHICGSKLANFHLTEVRGPGEKITRSYCQQHIPDEVRDKVKASYPQTPAEEVAYLREKLKRLDQYDYDPQQRAEIVAEVEQLIADIESGKRRLIDPQE